MFRIEDGRENFYQWDLDRKIIVNDPAVTQVHFCNRTDDCSLVVEVVDGVANVPNILLQDTWDIRVYFYSMNYTKVEKRFKVLPRTKPSDYVYTETEVKNYDAFEQKLIDLETSAKELSSWKQETANQIRTNMNNIDSLNAMTTNALNTANTAGSTAYNAQQAMQYGVFPRLEDCEQRLDTIENLAGDIENALTQISTLQASYITGGAEL